LSYLYNSIAEFECIEEDLKVGDERDVSGCYGVPPLRGGEGGGEDAGEGTV